MTKAKDNVNKILAEARRIAEALLVTAREKVATDLPFSNRELTMKFDKVETMIQANHDEIMGSIKLLAQKVDYTNGKVRWHTKLLIGVTVVVIVIVATNPALLAVIYRMLGI